MTKYQVMPAASAEADAELRADIKARGLIYPIVTDEKGAIIDGHRRRAACDAEGISFETIILSGLTEQQKIEAAYALNLKRRELTPEKRAELWIAMRQNGMSYRQIAEADGSVNKDTVRKATVYAQTVDLPDTVTGKDGKKRKARTGKPAPERAPPFSKSRIFFEAGLIPKDKPGGSVKKFAEQVERIAPGAIAAKDAARVRAAADQIAMERRPEAVAQAARETAGEVEATLAPSAQQRLEAAIRARVRVLEAEFETRVQDRVTQLLKETVLPQYNQEHDRHVAFNNAYRGVMTRDEYKRLLQFVHPDRHAQDEATQKKAAALFTLLQKKEELLCGVSAKDTRASSLPRTVEELLKRRARA